MTSLEDRTVPTASVSIVSLGNISEDGSSSAFRLTRTETTGTLGVGITPTGTASGGMDYTYSPMVVFADGSATFDLTITPSQDSSVEGTENIVFTISSGGGSYNVGSPSSATMTLYDDDTVQVSVAKQGGDPTEGSNGTFRITRSGSTSGNLTVNFTPSGGTATPGTDYTIGTSATITSGNSYVDVNVVTAEDPITDPDETVTITITDDGANYSAHGSGATASMTIVNLNHDPVIEEDQEFELLDSALDGIPVGTVVASDPDIDQGIVYSILSGNTDDTFEIDEELGTIYVANPEGADFDTNPVFTLTIMVTDDAPTPASTTETVVISLVQFIDDNITTEPQVVGALNDIFAKILQLRDVGGTLSDPTILYAPLNPASYFDPEIPGSMDNSTSAALATIDDMKAVPEANLNAVAPYFNLLLDLGAELSAMEKTVFAIQGLATDAMRLSEGDRVRQDGIHSLLLPIEDWVTLVYSALNAERERLANVNIATNGTQAWTVCHWLTEGLYLARLSNMSASLEYVMSQTPIAPISVDAGNFINGPNGNGGINAQQSIMAAVNFDAVFALANDMLTQGMTMLSSYNDSTNNYLIFYNAKDAYYLDEDALLGGTTSADFGVMGVMLDQVQSAIDAANTALDMEDNTAFNSTDLNATENNGVTDEFRRQGILARLQFIQTKLTDIADLLVDIAGQVDAINTAVINAGRWYMFFSPDPYEAVQVECQRAYDGFTDGVEVKGIGAYLNDIAQIIEDQF